MTRVLEQSLGEMFPVVQDLNCSGDRVRKSYWSEDDSTSMGGTLQALLH
ncbi:hypothetical protein [Vacuolonema iberomarrocanum]|nr:hypothetical protein [filamentous cyanobacterium LEGE 07170]